MNTNLTHIRSMAEMILSELDKIEGTKPIAKVAEPKFKVGDRVSYDFGRVQGIRHGKVLDCGPNDVGNHWYTICIDWSETDSTTGTWFNDSGLTLATEERVWHSGPPPHVGWWNASYTTGVNREMVWRWWDGKNWSLNVFDTESNVAHIGSLSHRIDPRQHLIEWTDYYPENARVPRINPGVEE